METTKLTIKDIEIITDIINNELVRINNNLESVRHLKKEAHRDLIEIFEDSEKRLEDKQEKTCNIANKLLNILKENEKNGN